jgi:hypothetical protein
MLDSSAPPSVAHGAHARPLPHLKGRKMKYSRIGFAVGALAVLACNTPTELPETTDAQPSLSDHFFGGVPGTPSCRGETLAFLAQYGKNNPDDFPERFRGLAGIARAGNGDPQDYQAIVTRFCDGV